MTTEDRWRSLSVITFPTQANTKLWFSRSSLVPTSSSNLETITSDMSSKFGVIVVAVGQKESQPIDNRGGASDFIPGHQLFLDYL